MRSHLWELFLLLKVMGAFELAQALEIRDSEIKSCLASVSVMEQRVFNETHAYTNGKEVVDPILDEDCQGIALNYAGVEPTRYLITAQYGNLKWSLNDKREMLKLEQ